MKPVALDICCRKGGATVGLQRAGFHVIGVDIDPQPGYPGDEFIMLDGLAILRGLIGNGLIHSSHHGTEINVDFIWQSWPCQDGNTATASNRARGIVDNHRQFISQARELSDLLGIPYVLEQPTSSRRGLIRRDLTLCMDMFKGEMPPPWVQKHRSFEIHGFTVPQPEHPAGPVRGGSMAGFPKPAGHATRIRGWRHGPYYEGDYVAAYGKGGGKGKIHEVAHAMQIDWMDDLFDLCEAIPPAFSEYIGRAFCDECIVYLNEHGGRGPQPRSARRVRILGAQQWRLCPQHAEPREIADKQAAELAERRTAAGGR